VVLPHRGRSLSNRTRGGRCPPPCPISNSKSLPTELRSFAIIRPVNELPPLLPELSVCLMNVSSSFLVQHQRLPNWSPWSCCLHSPPCHFLASVSNFLGSRKHSIPHGDFLWQHKMLLLNERRVRGVGGIQLFWPATWIFWTWIDFQLCVGKEIVTWRWQHRFPSWKFINTTTI